MLRQPLRSTLFPTRRSSDLGLPALPHAGLHAHPLATLGLTSFGRLTRGAGIALPAPRPIRSEEHTSELQSRRDIVCRLLLEIKNNASLGPIFSSKISRTCLL